MKTLVNPYIRLDLDVDYFKKLQGTIKRSLDDLGVPSDEPLFPPHISVGYVLETVDSDYIQDILKTITSGSLHMAFCGFECLPGLTTDFDYITLNIRGDSPAFYAAEYIAECCEVKKFNKGFSMHVTVLRIPKGLNESELFDFSRMLEEYFSAMLLSEMIPVSVTVCNKEAQDEMKMLVAA